MEKVKEKATGKGEKVTESMLEASAEEIQQLREKQKETCSKEINEILTKYNCDLTARIIVGEQGNIPQVFIVDRRNARKEK